MVWKWREYRLYLSLVCLYLFIGSINAQTVNTVTGEEILLSYPINAKTEYEAGLLVDFKPGASIKATEDVNIHAKINPFAIYPPTSGVTGGINPDDHGVVGLMSGEGSVGPAGNYTYSVPINLPSCVPKMNPNLSLVYNSGSLNEGYLGRGWALSGLSSISRVPSNKYYDNYVDPVDFNGWDRFSLDGNRLILISGNYGQPGSIYGFEMENMVRVYPLQEGNIFPSGFRVEFPDGKKAFYGESINSRVWKPNTFFVVDWLISHVEDIHGNRINYEYDVILGNGEANIAPKKITYTSNPNVDNMHTGFYSVVFNYTSSTRNLDKFSNQIHFVNNRLLNSVTIKAGNVDFVKYRIEYDTSFLTNSYVIKKVVYEDLINNLSLNPITFEYSTNTDSRILFSDQWLGLNITGSNKRYEYLTGDFNGDGYTDLIQVYKFQDEYAVEGEPYIFGGWKLFINDKSGTFHQVTAPVNNNNQVGSLNDWSIHDGVNIMETGDFNGDGRTDLLIVYEHNLKNYYRNRSNYIPNPTNCILLADSINPEFHMAFCGESTLNSGEKGFVKSVTCGDFLGKGYDCLLFNYITENIHTHINCVDFNFANGVPYSTYSLGCTNFFYRMYNVLPGFFNNDSKLDFYLKSDTTENYFIYTINEFGDFLQLEHGHVWECQSQFLGDYNGDGITDFLRFTPQGGCDSYTGAWSVSYGTGIPNNMFAESIPVNFPHAVKPNSGAINYPLYIVGDYNGDGYSDVWESYMENFQQAYSYYIYFSPGRIENFIATPQLISGTICPSAKCYYNLIDFNGDGKQDLFGTSSNYYTLRRISFYSFNSLANPKDQIEGLLLKVNNASLITENINYLLGKDIGVYTSNRLFFNQSRDVVVSPLAGYVVQKRESSAISGESGQYNFIVSKFRYKYINSLISKFGLGFLGFQTSIIYDEKNNIKTLVTNDLKFHQNYLEPSSVISIPFSVSSLLNAHQLINYKEFAYNYLFISNRRYRLIESKELVNKYDINADSSCLGTTMSWLSYDDRCLVSNKRDCNSSKKLNIYSSLNEYEHKKTVLFSYFAIDSINYLIGRPSRTEINDFFFNGTSWSSSQSYNQFSYFGQGEVGFPLVKEKVSYRGSPGNLDLLLIKNEYEYNKLGLVTKETVSTPNYIPPSGVLIPASKVSTFGYSIDKPWLLINVMNPKGFLSHVEFDVYGINVIHKYDINGQLTTFQSDNFQIDSKTVYPDGLINYTCRRWCNNSNSHPNRPPTAIYYDWEKINGSSEKLVFYNSLGLVVRTVTKDLLGKTIYQDKFYDFKGRLARETSAYCPTIISDLTSITTTYQYDLLDRIINTTDSHGSASVNYNGYETIFTDQEQKQTTRTTNSLGMIMSSKDSGGNIISYEYDCLGRLIKTWQNCNPTATMVLMEYDTHGNRTKLVDPSAGTVLTQYDPYNNIVTWKDSKLTNPIIYNYDILDRKIKVIEPEGVTSWTYDTRPNGLGLLSEVSSVNSNEKYFYDSFGKVTQVIKLVSGVEYKNSYLYDSYGRKIKDEYSTGLTLLTEYNKYGSPCLIYKGGFQPSVIWQSSASDGYGRLTKSKLGNQLTREEVYDENRDLLLSQNLKNLQTSYSIKFEYSWSNIGNLNYRRKIENGTTLTESFIYDNLSRLTSCSLSTSNGSKVTQTIGYDNFGNINNKVLNEGVILENGMYGENGNSPYALTSAEIDINQWPQSPQSVTYNSYNKVTSILEGDNQLNLLYGYDHQRVSQELKKNNVVIRKKSFIGSGIEVIEYPQVGKSERIHYLFDGSGSLFAAYIINESNVGKMYYIFADHLGSPAVISDAEGNFIQQLSYDAWGNRRDPLTWESLSSNTTLPEPLIDRGFTFHEHLYPFTLINMNGRVYDPLVGRFLSPDPFVQDISNSQSHNRYSYCFNNPFKYTDPDGQWVHVVIGAVVGGIINLGVKAYQGKINSWGDGFAAFGIGAVAGAVGAATGGAAFAAAGGAAGGAGGFSAGAVGGMFGSAASMPIQNVGNSMYFGDPMMTGKQCLMGIAIGGLVGGTINGGIALGNGRTFWNGTLPTPSPSPTPLPLTVPSNKSEIQLPNNGRSQLAQLPEENSFTLRTTTTETPNYSIEGQSIRIETPRPQIQGYDNSIANQTNLSHRFPYSFDDVIVQGGDFSFTSKGNYWYVAPGSVNSSNGWYSIGMYPNGSVFHRCFTTYYPTAH